MTRKDKLTTAAAMLETLLGTLDRELLPQCTCCGLTPRKSHWEFQRAIELEAMILKLRRWANPGASDFADAPQEVDV